MSAGVGIAFNTITDTVEAFLSGATVTAAGSVGLSAGESATIKALTIGSASPPRRGQRRRLGRRGRLGQYHRRLRRGLHRRRQRFVNAQGGGVSLSATDNSSITADAGGVGIALGITGGSSGGVTVGISAATNTVTNQVLAYIDGSTVNSAGALTLTASETSTIYALTIGGALSVGGGGAGVGVGLAGAGSGNTIDNTVEAYIQDNASVTTTSSGNVTLMATDSPTITANAGGVGSQSPGGTAGVGVSVGVGYASTSVADPVKAFITDSTVTAGGRRGPPCDGDGQHHHREPRRRHLLGGGQVGVASASRGLVYQFHHQ